MKLIELDALLAEIERLREEKGTFYASDVLYNLEDFLDTLEVKEVDLDDKIYDYINTHYSEGCDGGMISDAHNDIGGVMYSDLTSLAEHFYELGLKAQKGE